MHDLAKPVEVMKWCRERLKSGGIFVFLEMNCEGSLDKDAKIDGASVFYTVSLFHCLPQSLYTPNSAVSHKLSKILFHCYYFVRDLEQWFQEGNLMI
jgi:hypothetical protein